MCRNIRTLFNFEPPATPDEIEAASLQFVRKISGFTKPSRANEAAFNAAVDEIARISAQFLATLEATAAPKNREEKRPKPGLAPPSATPIEALKRDACLLVRRYAVLARDRGLDVTISACFRWTLRIRTCSAVNCSSTSEPKRSANSITETYSCLCASS